LQIAVHDRKLLAQRVKVFLPAAHSEAASLDQCRQAERPGY
jgi:hypothetical protein